MLVLVVTGIWSHKPTHPAALGMCGGCQREGGAKIGTDALCPMFGGSLPRPRRATARPHRPIAFSPALGIVTADPHLASPSPFPTPTPVQKDNAAGVDSDPSQKKALISFMLIPTSHSCLQGYKTQSTANVAGIARRKGVRPKPRFARARFVSQSSLCAAEQLTGLTPIQAACLHGHSSATRRPIRAAPATPLIWPGC